MTRRILTSGPRPAAATHQRRFLEAALDASDAIALAGLTLRAGEGAAGTLSLAADRGAGGYGPLTAQRPSAAYSGADPDLCRLALPEGFSYAVFGLSGSRMADGNTTPYAHAGMGCFDLPRGRVRLVRNHGVRDPSDVAMPPDGPLGAYDPLGGGGTTTLELRFGLDGVPVLERDLVSLSGTIATCAGGVTPWGSWLTAERATAGSADGFEREHGYVFEVPAFADSPVAPEPLRAMGRFVHDAVCVDPVTGIVYETEDRSFAPGDGRRPGAGFYRFRSRTRARLARGGMLQALGVRGMPRYDTTTGQTVARALPVEWVTVPDSDPAAAASDPSAVFRQALAGGAAIFQRPRGCWFGNGAAYFASSGGDAGHGQVWEYRPAGPSGGHLRLVYEPAPSPGDEAAPSPGDEPAPSPGDESPGPDVLSLTDGITLSPSPRGGILLCESAPGTEQRLRGVTRDGRLLDLCVNLLDDTGWAGVCFSGDGRYLFVSTRGVTRRPSGASAPVSHTYAIWGPWEDGAL